MAVSLLTAAGRHAWRQVLDRHATWLPFDWRLLAPVFVAGAGAGFAALLWALIFLAGPLV